VGVTLWMCDSGASLHCVRQRTTSGYINTSYPLKMGNSHIRLSDFLCSWVPAGSNILFQAKIVKGTVLTVYKYNWLSNMSHHARVFDF
jgi:hypothetical protein